MKLNKKATQFIVVVMVVGVALLTACTGINKDTQDVATIQPSTDVLPNESENSEQSTENTKNSLNMLNATYDLDGWDVTLQNGILERTVKDLDGSERIEKYSVWENTAEGDLNGDQVADQALIIIRKSVGTAKDYYISTHIQGELATGINLDEDNIEPKRLWIQDGKINFNYLTTQDNEPTLAVPTKEITRIFELKDRKVTEVTIENSSK